MTESVLTIPGGFRFGGFDVIRCGPRWSTRATRPDPNYQPVVQHWDNFELARRYVRARPDESYTHPPGSIRGARSIRFTSVVQQKLVQALRLEERTLRLAAQPTDDELQTDLLGTLDPTLDRVDLNVTRGPSWLAKE